MTWFKTDDGFWRHKKVRRLGDLKLPAVGLWQLAGSHSSDELSDGFVPFEVLQQWDPDGVLTAKLIEVNLWELDSVDGEDGIRFHDWLDWNPSREKVLADRERERLKKERLRAALAEKRRRSPRSTRPGGTHQGTTSGSPALPDPGSLPSSGNPASGGRGAERPPARVVDSSASAAARAEHVPTSDADVRAAARAELAAAIASSNRPRPGRSGRRGRVSAGQIPVMATVRPDPASAERAEQDRLAELDVVQAPPAAASPPSRASPADPAATPDPGPDLREEAS